MKRQDWIWMPHAGHFICGNDCRFILNTYVGNFIVSTVGEYWPDSAIRKIHAEVHDWNFEGQGDYWDHAYMKKFGFEKLGLDRTYETMVFKSEKAKHKCCPYRMANGSGLDFDGYNDPDKAYKGHHKLCKKWARKGKVS